MRLILCIILSVIASSHLLAMDNGFNEEVADSFLSDYSKLHPYLMAHVDKDCSEFEWKNALIKANEKVVLWIEKKALETGNMVCLYMLIRNFWEYCNIVMGDKDSNCCLEVSLLYNPQSNIPEIFSLMMLLLMLVAYDILSYYSLYKDATVFNTYSIMKQKMFYLLKDYASTLQVSDYPDIRAMCISATIRLKKLSHEHEKKFDCSWVKNFSWASRVPGTRGILFSPIILRENNRQDFNLFLPRSGKVSIIRDIFEYMAKCNSWEQFFSKYHFPLEEQELITWAANYKKDKDQSAAIRNAPQ